MTRRYYPGTRERLTRAFDEGVKARATGANSPYSRNNSGAPLYGAFWTGWWRAGGFTSGRKPLPVVDLSAEFADVIREVAADPPKCLERVA
jgi:hypothetical protein